MKFCYCLHNGRDAHHGVHRHDARHGRKTKDEDLGNEHSLMHALHKQRIQPLLKQ